MRTIGVLGGMGPAATADFLGRLVSSCAAATDQEHPPTFVYSASHVPDRTAHLAGDGPDPTSDLQRAARVLEGAGADLIGIPCNTAHAYHQSIQDAVGIPVLDMIGLAVGAVEATLSAGGRVGILAATGTIHLRLYSKRLREAGLEPLLPDDQESVMAAIRDVKGGRRGPDPRLEKSVEELQSAGAEAIILGCTELPLAVRAEDVSVTLVDAGGVLVRECLKQAGAALAGEPEPGP